LVITPSRKLHRQHRFRRQVKSERKSIIIGGRQLVDIFRIKRLIDRNLPVLAINQVRNFAEISFSVQLIDEFKQRSLSLEHNNVVCQIEQTRAATQIINQSGEDAATDGQMNVGGGFLDQTTKCQARNDL